MHEGAEMRDGFWQDSLDLIPEMNRLFNCNTNNSDIQESKHLTKRFKDLESEDSEQFKDLKIVNFERIYLQINK